MAWGVWLSPPPPSVLMPWNKWLPQPRCYTLYALKWTLFIFWCVHTHAERGVGVYGADVNVSRQTTQETSRSSAWGYCLQNGCLSESDNVHLAILEEWDCIISCLNNCYFLLWCPLAIVAQIKLMVIPSLGHTILLWSNSSLDIVVALWPLWWVYRHVRMESVCLSALSIICSTVCVVTCYVICGMISDCEGAGLSQDSAPGHPQRYVAGRPWVDTQYSGTPL